jgi:hypothetical protein
VRTPAATRFHDARHVFSKRAHVSAGVRTVLSVLALSVRVFEAVSSDCVVRMNYATSVLAAPLASSRCA